MQTQHWGDSHGGNSSVVGGTFSLLQRTMEVGVHILMGLLPSYPHLSLFLGYSHSLPTQIFKFFLFPFPHLHWSPISPPTEKWQPDGITACHKPVGKSAHIYSIYSGKPKKAITIF